MPFYSVYGDNYYISKFFIFMPKMEDRGHIVFVLSVILHSVILSFCPPLWNFNLANNFWTVRARALIFHMNIPCDKTFPWVPLFFTLWPWPWSLTHFLKNFNLANNFWTVSARALIFHMSIPSGYDLSMGTIIFDTVILTLEFNPFFWKL